AEDAPETDGLAADGLVEQFDRAGHAMQFAAHAVNGAPLEHARGQDGDGGDQGGNDGAGEQEGHGADARADVPAGRLEEWVAHVRSECKGYVYNPRSYLLNFSYGNN